MSSRLSAKAGLAIRKLRLAGGWTGEAGDYLGMDVEVEVLSEHDRLGALATMHAAQPPAQEDVALAS